MTDAKGRKWHVRDLVTDHRSGRLIEAKLWSNVCKGTMTFGFIWAVTHAQGTDWLWLTYGAVLLGHELGIRHYNQAQQKLDKGPVQ